MKKWILATLAVLSFNALAEDRTMTLTHLQNSPSYFTISVADNGTLYGTYPGWCVDWARPIQDGTYPVKFYSSLRENFPAGVLDKPENLDEMNWLLNQKFVGKQAPNGLGTYTSGDIQLAIWNLIDDSSDGSTVGPYSQARVDQIVNAALIRGNGFYPLCRQTVGIILDPQGPQTTVIEVRRDRFVKCNVPDGD
jgi:hypothetical protein